MLYRLLLAFPSAVLLIDTAATPPDGVVGLVAQIKELGLVGFLILVVVVMYRDRKAAEAKKDSQIESSTKALTENTASTNRLNESISDLHDAITRK